MLFIDVDYWVRREAKRVEEFCGDYIIDYLDECAENAKIDWTVDGRTDWEEVERQIVNDAEHYMEFIEATYPENIIN